MGSPPEDGLIEVFPALATEVEPAPDDTSPNEPAVAAERDPPNEPVAENEPDEPDERDEPAVRAEFKLELSGMVGLIGSDRTGGLTFGGPKFGLSVGQFGIGVSAYPSLLYSQFWETQRVRPNLGFGGEISYYGVTLIVLVYYVEDRYLPAAGLGYRFNFKRMVAKDRDERRRQRAERRR
jgi:hypothetical protein